ncbi:Calcium-transporting ATPase 10, plasma membrane-type [Trifolium repens]|nr:Calcium-transporting ATPase 10, plasma membrane-type [Trifolium repens]
MWSTSISRVHFPSLYVYDSVVFSSPYTRSVFMVSLQRSHENNEEQLAHWSLPDDDLVLLAIVGIKDPCRPGVKDSVQLCQKAGVKRELSLKEKHFEPYQIQREKKLRTRYW